MFVYKEMMNAFPTDQSLLRQGSHHKESWVVRFDLQARWSNHRNIFGSAFQNCSLDGDSSRRTLPRLFGTASVGYVSKA
ncbi:hypothetical protein DEA98_24285 [Brucella pseudogrignonensis]|jgi:hypothetical protein|nr:hypothetical protein [Brucella pseudogrignonensis]